MWTTRIELVLIAWPKSDVQRYTNWILQPITTHRTLPWLIFYNREILRAGLYINQPIICRFFYWTHLRDWTIKYTNFCVIETSRSIASYTTSLYVCIVPTYESSNQGEKKRQKLSLLFRKPIDPGEWKTNSPVYRNKVKSNRALLFVGPNRFYQFATPNWNQIETGFPIPDWTPHYPAG